MSYTLTAEMETAKNSQSMTLCQCVLITCKDGDQFGFANLDIPLTFDGVTYEPYDAIAPTAYSETNTLDANNGQLSTVFDSDRITEQDLFAGKFDNARVDRFWVDWTNLPTDLGAEPLQFIPITFGNRLSRTDSSESGVTFDSTGRDYFLEQKIGDITTRSCQHEFCDAQCTLNIATYTYSFEVTAIANSLTFTADNTQANGLFDNGTIIFTTGANDGISQQVAIYNGGNFELFQPLPYALTVGDEFDAIVGCPKTLDFCVSQSNAVNFGGFPTVPGNDFLLGGQQGG